MKPGQDAYVPTASSFREIITKAICGTGKQVFRYTEAITLPGGRIPSSILGSSVTRFKLTEPLVTEFSADGYKKVRVSGTFDLNVWYSYNSEQATDVARETIKFTEVIPIEDISETVLGKIDARAILTRNPQCQKTVILDSNLVQVEIDMEIYAEIVGETKVFVQVYSGDE